jgi:DNA mismatch repair ATPase MutS
MKALLMYHDHDFDLQQPLPWNEQALTQDLELHTLCNAMALGDPLVFAVAKSAVLSGLHSDLHTIRYRQNVLKDCLQNPAIVREIYAIAVAAIESEKKNYWSFFMKHPASVLHRSVEVLQMFVTMLKQLKHLADEHADRFVSEGFTALFAMLKKELDDDYFARVQQHLRALQFRDGVLLSAALGQGNKGTNYVLRKASDNTQSWRQRIFGPKPPVYTFHLHPRDESGARALAEFKDRGLNLVANALAQSTDHILSFFTMLRTELAFYVGCLNLHGQLVHKGEPVCFPLPVAASERRHAFQGLYDVCLTLSMEPRVVGNDVQADHTDLVIITGANQGGKSTFLRSIGVAQLMMQCGMFVPATSFSANLCDGLFTHYKREEDMTMHSGKLDEELSRMSEIVDHITAHAMVLFNESFAATNEREGSEIARQIICALVEKRLKMFFVTHVYTFARGFVDKAMANVLFLRAERQADGRRTFKLVEGEPLQTSYGEDLYHMIFVGNEKTSQAMVQAD